VKIYLVGGAVRDHLLGRRIHERDWVVVGAFPSEMEQLGFRLKDRDFPVYIHPKTGDEYALARTEIKRGSGYKGFDLDYSADITLEEDLARRDLTINAIAQSENGELIDPFDGQGDLRTRRLRHVTSSFVEDPLRVLRLARFKAELASFNFEIEPQTDALAAQMSNSGELQTLSPGRVWRETSRALASPRPREFFECLLRWGVLTALMPWMDADPGHDPQEPLAALGRASLTCESPDVRLASLIVSSSQLCKADHHIPEEWPVRAAARALVSLCTEHPPPTDIDATQILSWLESVDAWRRASRFSDLLKTWLAVHPQCSESLARLRFACDAARRVPAPQPGTNARDAVRAHRLKSIAEALVVSN
jgi:tRNA nucleotidyltransferase (CCA-adding enzyme)